MKFRKQTSLFAVAVFVFVTLFSSFFGSTVPASAGRAISVQADPVAEPTLDPALNVLTGDMSFETQTVGPQAASPVFDYLQVNGYAPAATRTSIVEPGANGTAKAYKVSTADANWQSVMKHARDTRLLPNTQYKIEIWVKGKICAVKLEYPGPVTVKDPVTNLDVVKENGSLNIAPESGFPDGFGPANWTKISAIFKTGANTVMKAVDENGVVTGDQDFGFIFVFQGSFGDGYIDEVIMTPYSGVLPSVNLGKPDFGNSNVVFASETRTHEEYATDGATITLTRGTTVLGTAVVKDFSYTLRFAAQKPGTVLTLKATKEGLFNDSPVRTITVKLNKPVIKSASYKSVYVKGTAYAGSKVTVYSGSKKLQYAKAGSKNTFSVKLKTKLKKGTKITVKSTYGKYTTTSSTYKVK